MVKGRKCKWRVHNRPGDLLEEIKSINAEATGNLSKIQVLVLVKIEFQTSVDREYWSMKRVMSALRGDMTLYYDVEPFTTVLLSHRPPTPKLKLFR